MISSKREVPRDALTPFKPNGMVYAKEFGVLLVGDQENRRLLSLLADEGKVLQDMSVRCESIENIHLTEDKLLVQHGKKYVEISLYEVSKYVLQHILKG